MPMSSGGSCGLSPTFRQTVPQWDAPGPFECPLVQSPEVHDTKHHCHHFALLFTPHIKRQMQNHIDFISLNSALWIGALYRLSHTSHYWPSLVSWQGQVLCVLMFCRTPTFSPVALSKNHYIYSKNNMKSIQPGFSNYSWQNCLFYRIKIMSWNANCCRNVHDIPWSGHLHPRRGRWWGLSGHTPFEDECSQSRTIKSWLI